MALKSLEVYNESKQFNGQNRSLLGRSNGFEIKLCHNAFWQYNSNFWRLINESFTGIMLENLSLNFQTDWNDAGGAILGKKIESIVNSKFVKMLAGQSDHGFTPFICSDAWTQQKVSGDAKPVIVQLKFKAYNYNRMGCTNYNDVIRFLIHICSPLKSTTGNNKMKIGDDIASTLNDAAAGGANILNDVAEGYKTFMRGYNTDRAKDEKEQGIINTANNMFAAGVKNLVETADNSFNKILTTTSNGKNNGNFTVNFALSNKIFDREISSDIKKAGKDENYYTTVKNDIDWIVKTFNFKPSRQFQMINDVPKPLWIDFDLTLETRYSLSNKYVYNVIVPQELNINEY